MNYSILTAILSKDSKDSTYKFALLRGLVDCITRHNSHQKLDESGWVKYPFGLLIYYWILYYYPLFSYDNFIPQKNGESPTLEKGKTIAFRREFNSIISFYSGRGELAQFRYDLIQNLVDEELRRDVILLLRKLQHTIKGMPMKHLGYSIFDRHYSLVKANNETIRTASYAGLIQEAGDLLIKPELHEILNELGPLIIGQDSIINGWADFIENASRRNQDTQSFSKEEIIGVLTESVDIPRDISQVRRVIESNQEYGLKCIWTGSDLKGKYHIDHAIPYSLWQNNNLWNLVPVSNKVNLRKSDRIPTPSLISESADRIKRIWGVYADNFEQQFEKELFEGLSVSLSEGLDSAIDALKHRSSYLIEKRGFQKFEIN